MSPFVQLGRLLATALLVLSLAGTMPVAAQSAAEGAIQDVIQRGNLAQAQALANRDPSLLGDSSFGAYTQQLIQTNQGLLDSGVASIELVNLDWGPITISGSNATATTFETWRTSYSDGPTEFARDRNVYSLVQNADGVWRITGDQHPDGRSRATAPPPEAPSPPPPDVQPGTGTSRNWSGYAARGGTFTSVSATWTVPQLALDGPFGADAAWVGIGGVRGRDLIQAGTQQTASGAGSVTYQAWIETLPDASQPVPLTVLPGDSVTVSLDQQSGDTWLVAFANLTSGQTLQRTLRYSSSLSSAEWIEEAPFARRRVLPISQFGSLTFTAASAVKDGQSLTIADLAARAISLVDDTGRSLAVPSPLSPDGASFTVSRT
jgi:peptidase A4-like protein